MTDEQIEKVAAAIDAVCFGSRFNDWTSNHVPGLPIEIYELRDDDDARIVARYPAHVGESEALRTYLRRQRAIAALKAMNF